MRPPRGTEPRWLAAAAGAAVLVGGALTSVQSRLNGELSVRFGVPIVAALWSFGSGWLVLTVLLLAVPAVRRALARVPAAVRAGEIRWWQCLGGLAGGCLVGVQTYAVPLAGVAVFTIAVVGGQTTSALVVDRLGLGPAGVAEVTPARLAAAVVAVAGVSIAVSAHGLGQLSSVAVPALLALAVGAGSSWQQAVNGRVNRVSANPMATTWLNFALGTLLLLTVALVLAVARALAAPVSLAAPWWAWLGGLCGIAFIAIAAWAVHHLGVLLFSLVTLTGQLGAALALDLLSPTARSHIGPQVVIGVAVTLAAAVLAAVSAQRQRGGAA